jgi:PAS domain S-box-containing protein
MADIFADRFRWVVESTPNGIIVVDGQGRITLVNRQIETLFGYKRSELIGRSVEVLIPERLRGHHELLRSAFAKRPETRPMGEGRHLFGRRKNGTEFPVEIGLNAVADTSGRSENDDLILATVVDITARKKAEDHVHFIIRELSHRTKNILAVVQAMAWQTARTSIDLGDFEERFTVRIDALACSHDLLAQKEWEGAEIEDLVHAQLAPFLEQADERLVLDGPSLMLKPEAAQNLGLALHELATNASKYGALSQPGGRINVGWSIERDGVEQPRFHMHWRERGGPEVKVPTSTGFGHSVIKQTVAKALAGEVALEFAPQGLVWRLTAPARRMFGADQAAGKSKDTMEEIDMAHDQLRGCRILVVEDDALLAMSVVDMLEEAGAVIVGPAATLDEANRLITSDGLSGAILDIRLNGDEVWPIAGRLAKKDVPFMFYSGHFSADTLPAQWAKRPILTKPARPKQILCALADLMTKH